jgi:hypothetical protein
MAPFPDGLAKSCPLIQEFDERCQFNITEVRHWSAQARMTQSSFSNDAIADDAWLIDERCPASEARSMSQHITELSGTNRS